MLAYIYRLAPAGWGRLLSNNYYYMCSKLIDKGRKRLTALPACSREYFITHKLNLKKKKKKTKQRMRQSLSLLYAAISCINLHFNASSSTHKLILLCRWGCCQPAGYQMHVSAFRNAPARWKLQNRRTHTPHVHVHRLREGLFALVGALALSARARGLTIWRFFCETTHTTSALSGPSPSPR